MSNIKVSVSAMSYNSSFSSFDALGPYAILTPTQAKLFWMPDIFIDKVKVSIYILIVQTDMS